MLTWPEIEKIATRMGANKLTVWKWRQRGVPDKWKLDIIAAMHRQGVNGPDKFPPPNAKRPK